MTTIVQMLRARANERVNQGGFVFYVPSRGTENKLSFAELDDQARAIASRLRAFAEPGARALLCYGPGLEFVQAFFGCLYAGIIAVPIELPRPNRDAPRLRAITTDAEPLLMLTSSSHELQLRPLAGNLGLRFIATDTLPVAEGTSWRERQPSPDSAVYLQYTSGSTATPKGVVISHRCAISNLSDIDSEFEHDRASVSVSWLPHFHDMGLVYGLLQPIYNGFQAVLLSPAAFIREPVCWLEAISRYKATHSGGPDFAYARCAKSISLEQLPQLSLASWRVAFTGAEKIRRQTLESFAGKFQACGFRDHAFYPAYGLAEATLKVTCRARNRPVRFRTPRGAESQALSYTSCGVPGPQTTIAIVDPETGLRQAPGRVGEVWVKSPSVALGYWRRRKESSETFGAQIPDDDGAPYLRTGDLGFTESGELHITGRCKDLVLIHGRNRHPEDVEALVAASHPALSARRCAAFSIEVNGAEELMVLVEAASRTAVDQELFPFVRQAVAEALEIRIHTIALVARGVLPVTSSGKLRRSACREAWIANTLHVLACDQVGASSSVENTAPVASGDEAGAGQSLRRIVADGLRVSTDDVPPGTPLIQLGLDSIGAIQIAGSLEAEFGITCSIERLLAGATLAELTTEVVRSRKTPRDSGEATFGPPHGPAEYRASLFQQRLWSIHRRAFGRGLLNIARAIRFKGQLNIRRLLRALDAVAQRHESLRISFSDQSGDLIAIPHALVDVPVPVVDLRGLSSSQRARAYSVLERRMAASIAALTRPPLWTACIILFDFERTELLWSISHLIADAASFDLLERDLAACYEGAPAGTRVTESYGSFARRQLAERPSPGIARQLQYWMGELQGIQAIPWREPAPANSKGHIPRRDLHVSKQRRSALEGLCRQEAATPFTILLATLEVVLGRYTRQNDFVVSIPLDCRPRDFRNVVGCFANRLPLRAQMDQAQPFRDHLHRVRGKVLEALENRDPAFAEIEAAFNSHRNASTADPLSQVLFELRQRDSPVRFGEIGAESKYLDPPDLAFDLFVAAEVSDGISFSFLFNGNRFDEAAATWFVSAYDQLLECLPGSMTKILGEIAMPDCPPWSSEQSILEIDVAANFVADGLRESLTYWMKKLEIQFRLQFSPFDQVMQYLLDPGMLSSNRRGVTALLIQSESYLNGLEALPELIPAPLMQFARALEAASRRAPETRFLVLFCPPSPDFKNDQRLDLMEREFTALARGIPGVDIIDSRTIQRLYPVDSYFDPHGNRMARIPYTRLCFASLGTMTARRIEAFRRHPRKAIVIDCDNTLWSGTVGEDGVLGVVVDEYRAALQRFLLRQVECGRLLCICSKNNERDVLEVLDLHPDMLLRREHFIAWRTNWRPKADNLRALAAELNVGLDSIIFLDDSAVECAHVRAECPEVLTVELPTDAAQIETFLDSVWEFDITNQTEEDRNRSQLYLQHAMRSRVEQSACTIEDFLAGLRLSVHIGEIDLPGLDRAAQLTERTNQFNLNGIRFSQSELRAMADDSSVSVLSVRARDRFGDYGTVGLMIYDCAETLSVKTFLLSCRALGKRIEHRMALALAEAALAAGRAVLDVHFVQTEKNIPIREFLAALGVELLEGRWRLPAQSVVERCQAALSPFASECEPAHHRPFEYPQLVKT